MKVSIYDGYLYDDSIPKQCNVELYVTLKGVSSSIEQKSDLEN